MQVLREVPRRDTTGAGPFLEEVLKVVKDFCNFKEEQSNETRSKCYV